MCAKLASTNHGQTVDEEEELAEEGRMEMSSMSLLIPLLVSLLIPLLVSLLMPLMTSCFRGRWRWLWKALGR